VSLGELLVEVWRKTLVDRLDSFEFEGRSYRVGRTRSQGLRTVTIPFEGRLIEGIEQNPQKTSQWAQRAQGGERIMQFRLGGRYIGNVAEGKLLRYPGWKSAGLAE